MEKIDQRKQGHSGDLLLKVTGDSRISRTN